MLKADNAALRHAILGDPIIPAVKKDHSDTCSLTRTPLRIAPPIWTKCPLANSPIRWPNVHPHQTPEKPVDIRVGLEEIGHVLINVQRQTVPSRHQLDAIGIAKSEEQ